MKRFLAAVCCTLLFSAAVSAQDVAAPAPVADAAVAVAQDVAPVAEGSVIVESAGCSTCGTTASSCGCNTGGCSTGGCNVEPCCNTGRRQRTGFFARRRARRSSCCG